ncbi:MAG: 50S ribosomal protein L15 [Proteobacteria bacterium]|nr:50S ribosomal protein L15 [Pseudomonadota bacterium]
MKLNELKPKEGARSKHMRVGRGIGSGKGKTCGRGVKGQKARTGVAVKGFEGGQSPLYRRLPKSGFTNIFAREYTTLTLGRLQQAIDDKLIDAKKLVDEKALAEGRVIARLKDGVRLVATGTLKAKVDIKVAGASKSAIAAVEKAGGKVEFTAAKEKKAPAGTRKEKKTKKKAEGEEE